MALLLGFFFACILAFLVFLPFLWLGIFIAKKQAKKKDEKNVSWLEGLPSLILLAIGIYLAIQTYNYIMGGLANSLNP